MCVCVCVCVCVLGGGVAAVYPPLGTNAKPLIYSHSRTRPRAAPKPPPGRFVVVHHGLEERRTPGNTLAVQPDKPYQGLAHFGTGRVGACYARGWAQSPLGPTGGGCCL